VRLCDVSGAQMRSDYEGTSLDALRQMVSIGMGLSLFPSAYVSSEFERETGSPSSNCPICRSSGRSALPGAEILSGRIISGSCAKKHGRLFP
jgi:DNA-binding transcriptional LysR family regulator